MMIQVKMNQFWGFFSSIEFIAKSSLTSSSSDILEGL